MTYVLTYTSATVVDDEGDAVIAAYGPFRTEGDAMTAAADHTLPALAGGTWQVHELRSPSKLATDTGAEVIGAPS